MLKKIHAGAAVVFLAFSGYALADPAAISPSMTQQEIGPQRARMLQIIQEIDGDPARRAAAITAGHDRSVLCADCHGATGNSVKPGIPNLASQNPAYLLDQIDRFATGRRKNFVMNALASNPESANTERNSRILRGPTNWNCWVDNRRGRPLAVRVIGVCHRICRVTWAKSAMA